MDMVQTNDLQAMGRAAKAAAAILAQLPDPDKQHALNVMADALVAATDAIMAANRQDLDGATIDPRFVDRLRLTPERIQEVTGLSGEELKKLFPDEQ